MVRKWGREMEELLKRHPPHSTSHTATSKSAGGYTYMCTYTIYPWITCTVSGSHDPVTVKTSLEQDPHQFTGQLYEDSPCISPMLLLPLPPSATGSPAPAMVKGLLKQLTEQLRATMTHYHSNLHSTSTEVYTYTCI